MQAQLHHPSVEVTGCPKGVHIGLVSCHKHYLAGNTIHPKPPASSVVKI
jgi:hypothetical protein